MSNKGFFLTETSQEEVKKKIEKSSTLIFVATNVKNRIFGFVG